MVEGCHRSNARSDTPSPSQSGSVHREERAETDLHELRRRNGRRVQHCAIRVRRPGYAQYINSATGSDSDLHGFFRADQQAITPHVDTTSNAHQVPNRRRSLLQEKQPVAADRCLELAADCHEPNGRDVCYTNPLQFEELGPCADC